MSEARNLAMHDVLRYASTASAAEAELDGLLNFHYVTSDPQSTGLPILQLSRGIWATSPVIAADGERRGVIALRSTPWNAGGESTRGMTNSTLTTDMSATSAIIVSTPWDSPARLSEIGC